MTFGVGFAAGAATAYACNWGYYGGYGSVTVNNNYHYNQNNVYHYNSATGAHGAYNANDRQLGRVPSEAGTYTATTPRRGRTARTTRRRASTARTTRRPAPTTRTARRVPQPGLRLFRVASALVVGRRALRGRLPREPVQRGRGLRERVRRRRPGERLPYGGTAAAASTAAATRRAARRRIDERRIARGR